MMESHARGNAFWLIIFRRHCLKGHIVVIIPTAIKKCAIRRRESDHQETRKQVTRESGNQVNSGATGIPDNLLS